MIFGALYNIEADYVTANSGGKKQTHGPSTHSYTIFDSKKEVDPE